MGDSSANEASLTILGGPKAGQCFIVEESVDNIVIGSDPSCRFQIDLPGVSPVHARIWIDPQGVTVYETNSPRGLYVNDDRVVAQAPLRNGDVLWLGTPGDEDVVMIQCRFPRGEKTRAAPAPQAVAEEAMGDTLAFGARPATPEPEEVEPEEAAIETDVADVEPEEAGVEPDEAEPAIEAQVAAPTPPTEVFMVEDDVPVVTAEPAKFDMDFSKPDLPSNFEEEIHDVAAAARAEPEPPPPIAPPEPPPVIAAPPPPPPPRAVSAAPPPAPAPRRAAARPAPAPTPAAAAPAARATGGGLPAAVKWGGLAAGLVVLAVGGYAVVRMLGGSEPARPPQQPPPPATSLTPASPAVVAQASAEPTPEPTPEPEAPPPMQEEVTIVQQPPATIAATPAATPPPSQRPAATPTPSQRPSPTPRPTQKPAATPAPTPVPADTQGPQLAALVPGLLAQAEAAAGARNFDAAIGHYDEVLRLDSQNGRAVEGKAAAQAGAAALKRTFVAGRTSMSGKAAKADGLGGFDTTGVTVAKVPDYSGRVEFEVSPTRVLPGDRYTVRIFLVNDGKKAFKLGSVAVNTTTNGTRAGGSIPMRAREVEPKDRIVLDERTAEWPAGVQSWTLEAVVQTDRDATFTNRLNWR